MRSGLFKIADMKEWQDRFTDAGLKEDVFKELVKTRVIDDYSNLHRRFLSLRPEMRRYFQSPWQLICLSGETKAFDEAVKQDYFNAQTKTLVGAETPLHYAALSGSKKQLLRALDLGIAFDTLTDNKSSILQYAVLSREPKQVEAVLDLEKKHGILPRANRHNRTLLHLAAVTGDVDVVKAVWPMSDAQAKDHKGYNAMDYALIGGNHRVINMFTQLGIQASGQNLDELLLNPEPTIRIKLGS